jgi:hypothetical protein
MGWAVLAAFGFIIVWLWSKYGGSSFWRLVGKHPDRAYEFFQRESCWFVDALPSDIARDQLTGPFKVFVPSIGRTINIWGLNPAYLESEKRFEILIRSSR